MNCADVFLCNPVRSILSIPKDIRGIGKSIKSGDDAWELSLKILNIVSKGVFIFCIGAASTVAGIGVALVILNPAGGVAAAVSVLAMPIFAVGCSWLFLGAAHQLLAEERAEDRAIEACAQILLAKWEGELRSLLFENLKKKGVNESVSNSIVQKIAEQKSSKSIDDPAVLGKKIKEAIDLCETDDLTKKIAWSVVADTLENGGVQVCYREPMKKSISVELP